MEEIREWSIEGVSEQDITQRLQTRVPEFNMSTSPGGQWDWLLGTLALTLTTGLLWLAGRKLIAGRDADYALPPADTSEDAEEWEDRLDDELIESS